MADPVNVEEDVPEDDLWADEDQINLTDVPEVLWSDAPLDKPPTAPEEWVDQLADESFLFPSYIDCNFTLWSSNHGLTRYNAKKKTK